jgi:hypothetical protein
MTRKPLVLAFLLCCSWAWAADPGPPRWKFQKGQALNYLLKHGEVRTVEVGDQKLETTTRTEYEWTWTVADIGDKGTATLEQKLTALRVSCTGKDFQLDYDSARANTADDDYRKKLIRLLDQVRFFGNYQVRLGPRGEVVEVRGFSKLLEEHDPGMNILDFHALNLHDDTFGWFLGQALGRLPDAEQARKAKWRVDIDKEIAGMGPVTGSLDFTLKKAGADRRTLELDFQGTQTLDLDMKWIGIALRGKLQTTKLAGNVRFDAQAGALESSTAQIDMKGDLKFGDNSTLAVSFQHNLELQRIK